MKKIRGVVVFGIIVILLFVVGYFFGLFSVFQTSNVFLGGIIAEPGYGGTYDTHDRYIGEYNLNTGKNFKILNYEIVADISDAYYYQGSCKVRYFPTNREGLGEDENPSDITDNCNYGGYYFDLRNDLSSPQPVGCESREYADCGGACGLYGGDSPTKWLTSKTETYIDDYGCQHWDVDILHPDIYCSRYDNVKCNNPASPFEEYEKSCNRDHRCFVPDNTKYWNKVQDEFTETIDYGGPNWKQVWGCGYMYKIYKDGELIASSGEIPEGYGGWYSLHDTSKFENDEIKIYFGNSPVGGSYYAHTCWAENFNAYIKIPDNAFDVIVTSTKKEYYKGENATIEINFKNNWMPLKGIMTTEFEVPTVVGSAKSQDIRNVDLQLGDNILTYDIPTQQTTDKLYVMPKLKIIMPTSSFSNVNVIGYKCQLPDGSFSDVNHIVPVEDCIGIDIGDYIGDRYEVSIYSGEVKPEQELTGVWAKINNLWSSFWSWILGVLNWI